MNLGRAICKPNIPPLIPIICMSYIANRPTVTPLNQSYILAPSNGVSVRPSSVPTSSGIVGLDHLLAQLSILHSLRPKLMCGWIGGGRVLVARIKRITQ